MKVSQLFCLVWAVGVVASLCRPSTPSSSSVVISSSSITSSPASSPPAVSSSSSLVISSSSSSSAPAPSHSHTCGNQLIPSADMNLVNNAAKHWVFSTTNGASTDAFDCLTYLDGCTSVDGSTATGDYSYSISYSTPSNTLSAGVSYRFFFEFNGYPTLPGKPMVCTADNSVGPATASFVVLQEYSTSPNIVSFDFTSTYTEATITCSVQTMPQSSYWILYAFSLEQLC